MPMRLCLALAATALLAGPVAAFDLTAMTEAERDAFGKEVRAYLLDNPEVLIEVINLLDARQAQAEADADAAYVVQFADALFNDGHSWVGGNPDGDITLVEFMDYRCGYCRRAFAEVDQLLQADGNIRFIVKEYPILGPESDMAARFAIAVQQLHDGQTYGDIHDALMSMNSDVTPDSLTTLAGAFGLDPAPIMNRMTAPEVEAVIAANRALGEQMQITGTPTFILGGQMIRGYVPLAQMQTLVAQARADAPAE